MFISGLSDHEAKTGERRHRSKVPKLSTERDCPNSGGLES